MDGWYGVGCAKRFRSLSRLARKSSMTYCRNLVNDVQRGEDTRHITGYSVPRNESDKSRTLRVGDDTRKKTCKDVTESQYFVTSFPDKISDGLQKTEFGR